MQFLRPPLAPAAAPPPTGAPAWAQTGRVVITGFGLVTPLGYGAWDTFAALLQGRSIADRAARCDPQAASDPLALVREIGCVGIAQHEPADPAVVIAERAAREAAFMAGVDPRGLAAFLGTSKGAVTLLHTAAARWAHDPDPASLPADLAQAVAMGPHGSFAHQLIRRLGARPRVHHVGACASSLLALDHARRWLLDPKSQGQKSKAEKDKPRAKSQPGSRLARCGAGQGLPHDPSAPRPSTALVLTAEAALLPLFIHSYRRLGVLADLTPAGYRQRPLDRRRKGFMLAELGAAVILQRLPTGSPTPRGAIELLDTATAAEAHDMVRAAPGMAALRHVAHRLIAGRTLGLIHPHAPGTTDHDAAELDVYRDLRAAPTDLYAAKGAIGHGLGASGLVSLVIACLCLRAGRRPPMPWLQEPMDRENWPPLAPAAPVDRALPQAVFASGFAGHTAGALIQKSEG